MKTEHPTDDDLRLTDSLLCSFVHYRPRVFSRVLRLPSLIGTLLHWRASSRTLLAHLLTLLDDETDFIEIAHADLALSLWPDLSVHSGKNKLTKWLGRFDEDQYLSRFQAIERKRGRYKEVNGERENFPSVYRVKDFYAFAEIVGQKIMETELIELEQLKMRHAAHRKIVTTALVDFGAVVIMPGMTVEKKGKGLDRPKCIKGITSDSPLFPTLPLIDRVEIILAEVFDVSKRAFELVGEVDTYDEAYFIVEKVLKYQAANGMVALDTRRQRQANANKPKGAQRLAVNARNYREFDRSKLVGETVAKLEQYKPAS